MIAGGAELTLIVPGLAGPADPGTGDPDAASRVLATDLALHGLARLVSRAGTLSSPHAAADAGGLLLALLGVERTPHGDVPAAALSRLATADAADAAGSAGSRDAAVAPAADDTPGAVWMRADPVHLRAGPTRLVLMEPASLGLSVEEARAIAGWLAAHPHGPDLDLEVRRADAWYVRLPAAPRVRTSAPSAAHGDDARHHLPAGPDAPAWHARMNEIQMLLHECPVNAGRERAGRLPVNSLWFWGAGALPAASPSPPSSSWDALHGDGDLIRGAAAWCGIPAGPRPDAAHAWLAGTPAGRRLLVLPDLHAPARDADTGAWREAIAQLDAQWLSPLADALARGRLGRVAIHAGAGAGLAITRREARRWWRRAGDPADALVRLRRAAAAAPAPASAP